MQMLLDNQTDCNVPTELLQRIGDSLTDRTVEVLIVNDAAICELNARFRDKNSPTDVLSFPLESVIETMPLGSVVINADQVKRTARELGHTIEDECALMFIHGMLHLLGYDHETDEGQMREAEAKLITTFQLPDSLILRTLKEG